MDVKKIVACAGTVALVAGCFAGSAFAKTKVNYWYAGGSKPQKVMKELIAEFNASQNEYEMMPVLQGNYAETFQKLQAGFASSTQPALALLDGSQTNLLWNKKLLRDIRPYMDNAFNFDDFLGAFRTQVTAKGGAITSIPAYGTTQVFYYNKKALADAGFTPADLKTWQSLAKVAAKVAKPEQNYYGWEPMWGPNNLIDAGYSNGARVISEDGKTVLLDRPEWVEVWETIRKGIHDDKTMRIHHGGQGWEYWYKTIDDVMQDRALGYTGSSGDQADLDFNKLGAVPQAGFNNHPGSPQAGALVFVMPKASGKEGSDDAAAKGAFEFIRFYTSPANAARWSMATGYIPARATAVNDPAYAAYAKKNPQALVPITQAKTATPDFIDPTGGKILDAISVAADEIEIQNVPAAKALKKATKKAQRALDRVNRKK